MDRGRAPLLLRCMPWRHLCVELPDMTPGGRRVRQVSAADARFSSAGSAWVSHGFGHVGTRVRGTVVAQRPDSDRLMVDLDLELETRLAGDPDEVQTLAMRRHLDLRRIDIAGLSPWLGRAEGGGEHELAYRPAGLPLTCH